MMLREKEMFSKPIVLTLLLSLSFNGLFGYLSYKFYSDKAVAESQLADVVKANKSLVDSLQKKEAACKIEDAINTEYQIEKQELRTKTDSELIAIDKMIDVPAPQVQSVKPLQNNANNPVLRTEVSNETSNVYISLDSELPPSLVRLLSENCIRNKGSACTNP